MTDKNINECIIREFSADDLKEDVRIKPKLEVRILEQKGLKAIINKLKKIF